MESKPKTTQELIAGCQGLVRSLAWKIHCKLPRSVDLDDLVSYGQLGLVEAARDYEASRGGQFTTYAYHRVRGAILDGLAKMRWFNQADYHGGKYERMAGDVLDDQHAEHEASERGAGDRGALTDDVRWFKGASTALATVFLVSSRAEMGDGPESISDPSTPTPQASAMKREVSKKLNELIDALPTQAASLIRGAYFEGLTLKEAGERIGISKAWASRLHSKTLEQLAHSLESLQLVD